MSKVKIQAPGGEEDVARIACDGSCGAFIPAEREKDSRYTTEDGRKGHVCTDTCARAFEVGQTAAIAAVGHPQFREDWRAEPVDRDEDPDDLPPDEFGLGPGVPWPEGVPLPEES